MKKDTNIITEVKDAEVNCSNTEEKEDKKKKDKTTWVIIILLIIILLLLLRSCGKEVDTPLEPLKLEEGTQWDGKLPTSGKNSQASQENFDVIGYQDIYLSEEQRVVNLINPKGNTVFFKYTILNEAGEEIASTDLISPNSIVERDVYDSLKKGKNELTFVISTYDIDTQEVCNSVNLSVNVYIE